MEQNNDLVWPQYVKVTPQSIGSPVFFDTSNPEEKPESAAKYRKRKILSLVIGLVVLAIIWVITLASDAELGIIISILLSVLVLWFMIAAFRSAAFLGEDYFVGTEGYAIYHFKGSRDAIDERKEHGFKDFSQVLRSLETITRNGNSETKYSFHFLRKKDADVWEAVDSYSAKVYGRDLKGDKKYGFLNKVEEQFCQQLLAKTYEDLLEGIPARFETFHSFGGGEWQSGKAIILSPGRIQFGDKVYDKSNLGDIVVSNGTLYIFDKNYGSRLISSKGEKDEISLKNIGNFPVFVTILRKLFVVRKN